MLDGPANDAAPAELLICTTCRSAASRSAPDLGDETARPGARLLEELLATGGLDGVKVRGVECLSNCDQGCTIALRGSGRWTYVYGNLDPDSDLEAVREGVGRYRDAVDGLVPWRERPQHFRKNCVARVPPMES